MKVETEDVSELPSARPWKTTGADGRDEPLAVDGVRLLEVRLIKDSRGTLLAREVADGSLPFVPQRCFVVFDVPSEELRGEHAHRRLEQLLICLAGSVTCVVDDGSRRQEVVLDEPARALYLPPMVWGIQHRYSADARLLVLASDGYDPADYIRDYQLFREERRIFDRQRSGRERATP